MVFRSLLIIAGLIAASNAAHAQYREDSLLEAPLIFNQCPIYDDPNHTVFLPYTDDCQKYYRCQAGQGVLQQCPTNLYWSQITYRCDFKEYSSCIEKHTTPHEDVTYKPYENDCTRFYEIRVLRCPESYHWNVQMQRCDTPQNAGCAAFPEQFAPNEPTAATPPTYPSYSLHQSYQSYSDQTVAPSIIPAPINPAMLCTNAASNAYLSYPGDCHKFIHCGPTPTVLTCPGNLYWDRNVKACTTSNAVCFLLMQEHKEIKNQL